MVYGSPSNVIEIRAKYSYTRPVSPKYFELCLRRGYWQVYELGVFIAYCFGLGENILQKEPVKTASNRYEETLRVERPQHDLVTDMELELSRLLRYQAYAKIIDETENKQIVRTHRIETYLLPGIKNPDMEAQAIANGHTLGKKRDDIEAEIREQQNRWRDGGGSNPSQTREEE